MRKTLHRDLTDEQAMRYNRHIVLPSVDLDGQEALLNAKVLIVGMGGLGNAAAMNLCASGVGTLTLIDFDSVELTNLHRQTLFSEVDVSKSKVHAAQQQLVQMNTDCEIHAVNEAFGEEHKGLVTSSDVVLDCTDNATARDLINKLCYATNTPLISGAAIRFEGQLFVAIPGKSRCYECLRQLFTAPDLSCVESGIFSPVANIVGTYQSLLAMQVLMQFDTIPVNTLITFDALEHEWQRWQLPDATECDICGPAHAK